MNPKTEKKIVDLVMGGLSLMKVAIGGWKREPLPNKGNRKHLLILGNGPSLLKSIDEHHDLILNSDLIGVNHLSRSPLYKKLKPSVLVLTPIEFWDHEHDQFLKDEFYKTADPLIYDTEWNLSIIAPLTAKNCKNALGYFSKNKRIKIYFVNMTPIDGNQKIANWIMRNRLGLPRPHNVLIPALVVGINLGYKTINILGADHSWMPYVRVTEENQVVMVQKHFYDEKEAQEKKMYNANSKSFDRKLYEVLQKFTYAFKSYFVIDGYAKSIGCEIINLTPNSFIDAFKRKSVN
ncbi:hypothetical protein KFE94_03225 [bacterium SCSIO 12643]|nr:hypothetical protein KFE94_03225 [bacterium SCSIO 12643]